MASALRDPVKTSPKANQSGFFLTFPARIIQDDRLSWNDKAIWAYFNFRQGNNKSCWPKVKTIAMDLGISRPTVIKSIKKLIKIGLITRHRSNGGRHQSNTYHVRPPGSEAEKTTEIPESRAKNLDTRSESRAKKLCARSKRYLTTEKEKKRKLKGEGKGKISVFDIKIKNRINLHLKLCTVARTNVTKKPELKKTLRTKITKAVNKHGMFVVKETIKQYSAKSRKGDGWGPMPKRLTKVEGVIGTDRADKKNKKIEKQLQTSLPEEVKALVDKTAEAADAANKMKKDSKREEPNAEDRSPFPTQGKHGSDEDFEARMKDFVQTKRIEEEIEIARDTKNAYKFTIASTFPNTGYIQPGMQAVRDEALASHKANNFIEATPEQIAAAKKQKEVNRKLLEQSNTQSDNVA